MGLEFPAHGDIRIETRGRILAVEAFGIWNPEMYKKNMQNEEARSAFKAVGPWAMLLIRRDSMLVHAEILSLLKSNQAQTRRINQGLVAVAWVASPDLEGYAVTMPILLKYHRSYGPCEVFLTEEAACAWLNQKLAEAQTGQLASQGREEA